MLPRGTGDDLSDFDLVDRDDPSVPGLPVLLGAVLERVRERLEVDTAAVLLADRNGRLLTAAAARGIEAEVYQGGADPGGQRFRRAGGG